MDPPHFRQLLGRFATGVVVITARTPRGEPTGMTANSLASVSLVPPLISIAVELQAEMHQVLLAGPQFAINILSASQEALSRRFAAQPHAGRFDGVGYSLSDDGHVILDGVLAHLACERYAEYPAGDHTLFVARVTGGATAEGRPLLYYRGGYASLGPG